MSGGQESLRQCGVKVNTYYASEIKDYSIAVAKDNFPNTVFLGDMTKWKEWDIDWSKIDLLLGGMPCQGFSIAGKKLNFDDPRSKLFFIGVDILNHIRSVNPNIKFLFENVKMKDEISSKLDECVGIKHLHLNSVDYTGMIRKRFYWSNLKHTEPKEQDVKIKDLIDNGIPFNKSLDYLLSKTIYNPSISSDGIITINPRDKNGKQTWQRGRVYDIEGKCPTICESLYDLCITKDHKHYRKLTRNELEHLQGFPRDYTRKASDRQAGGMLGDGWNIKTINSFIENM